MDPDSLNDLFKLNKDLADQAHHCNLLLTQQNDNAPSPAAPRLTSDNDTQLPVARLPIPATQRRNPLPNINVLGPTIPHDPISTRTPRHSFIQIPTLLCKCRQQPPTALTQGHSVKIHYQGQKLSASSSSVLVADSTPVIISLMPLVYNPISGIFQSLESVVTLSFVDTSIPSFLIFNPPLSKRNRSNRYFLHAW
jgi:hypothetical protein